jgi:hypothetical protein
MTPSGEPARHGVVLSGRTLRRVLAGVAALSVLAMIASARSGAATAMTIAAAAFAVAAVAVAAIAAVQAARWPPSPRSPLMPAFVALLQSARFAAICYAWGAVAMQGVYLTPLTGLRWQHGWQYATAMALLAIGSLLFARSLAPVMATARPTGAERQFRWAVPLALAQTAVAAIGLAALLFSGKLLSTRADWAANRVFAGLAVAVLAVSLASIFVQQRLRRAA